MKAVFSEAQFNPELAQTLADEAGITQRRHDALQRRPGPPPADTYLGMMRYDIDRSRRRCDERRPSAACARAAAVRVEARLAAGRPARRCLRRLWRARALATST